MRIWLAFGCGVLAGCGARTGLDAPAVGGGGFGGTPGLGGSGGSGGSPTTPVYCQDAGPTTVFVVTAAANLYSFDPPSGTFTLVTALSCPSASSPETMAVDHEGTAYVTYDDGTMWAVDLASQKCTSTPFSDGSNNGRFGSCFAANPGGQGETLFLMDDQLLGLYSVDTTTFAVTEVGMVSSDIGSAELTGTGDGRLFAFGTDAASGSSFLAQLDPATAAVISQTTLAVPMQGGFAFAFWGGDFYFFTGAEVARFVPGGKLTPGYAMLPGEDIVGAGVSTCAPVH